MLLEKQGKKPSSRCRGHDSSVLGRSKESVFLVSRKVERLNLTRVCRRLGPAAATLGVVLVAAACSSSDNQGPGGSEGAANFGVVFLVLSPEGRSNYLAAVDDLLTGEIDPSRSLELVGQAVFSFPPTPQGYAVAGRIEDLTLTRYDFSRNGSVSEGPRLSLAATGASTLGPLIAVNETKSYHISTGTREITIYDPTTMTITGSIGLPEESQNGFDGFPDVWFDARQDSGFQVIDGRLYASIYWADFTAGTSRPSSGLLIVDVETDRVVTVAENRCPMATDIVNGGDGFLYLGTNGNAPFIDSLRSSDLGCVERIRIGSTAFDEDYRFRYQEVDNSLPPAGAVLSPSAEPGKALVAFLDEGLATWAVESDASWYTNIWRVFEVDLRNRTIVREATEFGPSLPWLPAMTLDGDVFLARGEVVGDIERGTIESQDYTLTRLTDQGFESGVEAPGEIWALGRFY